MGTVAGVAAAVGAAATVAGTVNGIVNDGSANTTTSTSGPPAWVQQDYQQAAGLAGNVAGQPLNQYQGQMVAGFTPYQLQAMQGVEGAQGIANPYINTASQYASSAATPIGVPGQLSNGQLGGLYGNGLGYSNEAANTNIAGAGYPGISNAYAGANYGQQAAGQGAAGIGRAVGMGSAQNYAGNLQSYMSPYTQDVVNQTQAQFNNQNQQQQQGVVGSAIQQGAYGGDRASVAQGITAGQEQLAQAPVIAGLENQGYTNAQQQLDAQQQMGIQGGQAAGQLGLSAGQLQASTGLSAGQMGMSAAQQQAALQQQSAQAQFGLFSGQQQAGIGAQEASGWLGANAANIYGALGQQAQSSALTNASSLYSMGSAQQGLEQQELNIPYEQFNAQQAYPYQAAQFQINALEGLGSNSGGTSSTTGPSPSPYGQVAGLATAGAGLYGAFNGNSTGVYDSSFMPSGTTGLTAQSVNTYDPSSSAYSFPTSYQARGGRVGRAFGGNIGPQGFASGGAPVRIGGGPIISGSDMGSRGISHPVLRDPTGEGPKFANWAPIPQNLKSNYSPPPVSSLPYTSTTFPVLSGGTGAPSTVSVTPVQSKNGTWAPPPGQLPAANPNSFSGTPSTIPQLYEKFLGRQPDPSGLSYWNQQGFQAAETGIEDSPEAMSYAAAHAGGGAVGFRSHYDDGGGVVAQSGAASAGLPVAGGNPLAQGMYQNFANMPPEKLQELAARLPASSAQGQMVRRALQMSHVNPQQQQQASQPPMARGGRATFASGGDASDFDSDTPFGGLGNIPGVVQPPGAAPTPGLDLGQETPTIFDAIGGDDAAAAKGFGAPPSAAHKHAAPAGFTPHGPSTIPAPPPAPNAAPAVAAGPDVGVSIHNLADAANKSVDSGDDDSSSMSRAMKSPWMSLVAAGAGMMASRSPFAGVAIGEGLESGLKFAGQQASEADKRQAQENENLWKNKDIDLRVQDMSQRLDQFKQTNARETQAESDRKQAEQDRNAIENSRLGIDQSRLGVEAIGANAHVTEANRGYWEPVRALTDPATGKPITDANGVPQAMWTNRYTGETKSGPAADPSQVGGKSGGAGSASSWKYNAWLAVHPDDTEGALDFVAGHKQLSQPDAMRYGYEQASKELSSGQINQSDVDARAKEVAATIYGPGKTAAATSAPPAAGVAAPAAAGVKPTAPVVQNGNLYDPVTHAYLGPAP